MKSSDMIWRCTNRSCIAKLRTDSAISTIIPSGTGLVEKIQTRLQYNDNCNEIRKRLDYSFGFHFLCPSNVESGLKSHQTTKEQIMRQFHAQFYTAHPTIFVFLEVLVILLWQTEGVINWSLSGKFPHLYEFSLPGHNLVIT